MQYTVLGQQCVNVFWYQVPASGMESNNAAELRDLFNNNIVPFINNIISANVDDYRLDVINWRDPQDSSFLSDTDFGESSLGTMLPSFVTMTFRSQRTAPGKRYSYKRFAGITSTHIVGNTPVDNGSDLSNIADALAVTLEINQRVYAPVQVKTSTLPHMGTGQPTVSMGLGVSWDFFVGSQNSRKPGVGA